MTTVKYAYGSGRSRTYSLRFSDELLAVRTHSRNTIARSTISEAGRSSLDEFHTVATFDAAGVSVLRCHASSGRRARRDRARKVLKKEEAIRFAGRVLCDPKSRRPVLYTENLFVKFFDDVSASKAKRILKAHELATKHQPAYCANAYFVGAAEGSGLEVFDIAAELQELDEVELCHPELIRETRRRAAFDEQWHLKQTRINGTNVDQHANVEAAWALSDGQGTTIAVIDDGVDVDHEEFAGAGKVVAPRDVTAGIDNPRPHTGDNHGTACAGVACAAGNHHASGVAPRAMLMPIRLASGLGSQAEAEAFFWAAQHGADVISCSWGPQDGDFTQPDDPLHDQVIPLPDSTRLAIEHAVTQGRNGKGCVITWAAGNGGESVDNDGYASSPNVVAVGACNDKGRKSPYSDFGNAVWCAFPSNNYFASITPGIFTTDRSGTVGYDTTDYTESFGGTSSACPGAAGVAALVIARNPALRWDQVKDILKNSCDRIDPSGGAYGPDGHSALYGFGRLNARAAVELALPRQASYTAIHKAVQDVPIRDLETASIAVEVGDTKLVKDLRVAVDIEHTWRGDLVVTVKPPTGGGLASVVLHDRQGRGADNLRVTYDTISAPGLADYIGEKATGRWRLSVKDTAEADTGRIVSFALELDF